jgi:hypothetical protein
MWNDSAAPEPFAARAQASERELPPSVVQVVWAYRQPRPDVVKRLRAEGFDVWAAPGDTPDRVRGWRSALLEAGGTGLVLTQWIPCIAANRAEILGTIRSLGPLLSGRP